MKHGSAATTHHHQKRARGEMSEDTVTLAAPSDVDPSACRGVNDGRQCLRVRDHNGPCRFRGLRLSTKRKRARALLLPQGDRDVLRGLLELMRDRKLSGIELRAKDAIERLLGRDD